MSSASNKPLSDKIEIMASEVVDAAFQVHKTIGPGLLESVYQSCLCYELSSRKIPFQTELALPIHYKNIRLDAGLRLDILVDDSIILELKAVEQLIPLHEAQLLSYLKLADKRLGFLLNFNVPRMKDGMKRIIL